MTEPLSDHLLISVLTLRLTSSFIVSLACVLTWTTEDFTPVVSKADLDPAVFAEWMDGKETVIGADRRREGPAWLVWTRDSQAGWYGQEFGDSKAPGARHLRIGFSKAVAVGTILAVAEGISVLKAGAVYPGALGDDTQWIEASRLTRDGLSATVDVRDCATWVLPPGTTTRAVRVTHVAKQNDRRYNGWIGALWLLVGRYELKQAEIAQRDRAKQIQIPSAN